MCSNKGDRMTLTVGLSSVLYESGSENVSLINSFPQELTNERRNPVETFETWHVHLFGRAMIARNLLRLSPDTTGSKKDWRPDIFFPRISHTSVAFFCSLQFVYENMMVLPTPDSAI